MRPYRSLNPFAVVVHCTWLVAAWRVLPVLAVEALPPAMPEGGAADLALASPQEYSITPLAPDGGFGPAPADGGSMSSSSPLPDDSGMLLMQPAILPAMPAQTVNLPDPAAVPADFYQASAPLPDAEAASAAAPPEPSARAVTALAPSVLPAAPSGFSGSPGGLPLGGGLGDTILDGFSIAATLSAQYDSNVTQSPGGSVAPVQDDFILGLGGNLSYMSQAAAWTFGGSYRGSYNTYFNESDYSGYNQGGGLVANYDGAKLSATMNVGVDFDRGANRYYGAADFVERTNVNTGLTTRYRLSTKTTLQGNIGQSFSTSSGDYDDTESFDIGASALWKYSPLTEWGPGIRYTYDAGSAQIERTSIGPTLTVNYKLSKKVAMNSRVGVDFASYEDGGSSDPMLSASIGLNYAASKLWGMNVSLYRDAQADVSQAGAFTEVSSLRLGFNRKVRRATLNFGVGYETNSTEYSSDVAGGDRPDRDYLSLDSSLGMAVFSNSSFASVFMRYNDQSGSATDSWDAFQTGFSLSRSF